MTTPRRDDLVRAAGHGLAARTDRLASVEREIRQAQAEALGRVGERLQALLDRLAGCDRHLDALAETGAGRPEAAAALAAALEARNRVRDEAARVRHHLIVQREALGLVRHGEVDRCYPVPARRRPAGSP
jgi:hypothetical protein